MPLEENDLAQIKTAIESGNFAENPELKKISGLGLSLHTETTLNDVVDQKVKPIVADIYSNIDRDFAAATGIQKDTNEKTYDYLKRAIPVFGKSQADKAAEDLQKKITELETAVAEKGDPEGVYKKKLADAEADYKRLLDEKDKEIGTFKKTASAATKRRLLAEAHAPIKGKYRSDLPSYFNATEKSILDNIAENSMVVEDEQGNEILVMKGADGEPLKKEFKVIPVDSVLQEHFKDAMKSPSKKGGPGGGGDEDPPQIDPNTITAENFEMPDSVKTQAELIGHLQSVGLKQGQKVFDEIYSKFGEKLKLR